MSRLEELDIKCQLVELGLQGMIRRLDLFEINIKLLVKRTEDLADWFLKHVKQFDAHSEPILKASTWKKNHM